MSKGRISNMNSSTQIKMGALISYIALGINTVASLIYIPWMVNVIGQADYALYTLATTFISLFMVDFGLSSAVSRYVAKYKAEGKTDKIFGIISTVERLYCYIGIIIFFVLFIIFFALDAIYIGLTAEELSTYKKLYIIVSVYSIVSFPCMPFSGILTAYEKFIQLKLCDLFQKLLSVFMTIVILLYGGDVTGIVISTAISGLLVSGAKVVIILKKTDARITITHFDKSIAKEVFSFSMWVTIISLAQRCVFNVAPSILGIVSNSEEIAIFAPATTLEACFYQFSAAVNGLFLATVSRLIAEKKEKELFDLGLSVGRFQLIVMGWIYVGFVVVGKEFMIEWMGPEYIKAWHCALLLFLPDIFIFTQQIANTTAIAKNKVKQLSFGYIGMALISISLAFILGGRYGVIGVSIAIMCSYIFLFIYMSILYQKLLGFDMRLFFYKCYASLVPIIIVVCIVCVWICSLISFENIWMQIIMQGIMTTCIYFFVIYLAMNTDEKSKIKRILCK